MKKQLPEDILLLEIIPLLPRKSQVRFKAVSKRWLNYVMTELASSPTTRTPIRCLDDGFAVLGRDEKEVSFYRLQSSAAEGSYSSLLQLTDTQVLPIPPNCGFWVGSTNGVLFYYSIAGNRYLGRAIYSYHIYNPLTKHTTTLPPRRKNPRPLATGLAVDPRISHYKFSVVTIPGYYSRTTEIEIAVFDSIIGGWKTKNFRLDTYSNTNLYSLPPSSVCFNGNLYWITPACLFVLTVQGEYSFRANELPQGCNQRADMYGGCGLLWTSEGRLYFCQIDEPQGLCIWVHLVRGSTRGTGMEWRKIFSISYEALDEELYQLVRRIGCCGGSLYSVVAFDVYHQIIHIETTNLVRVSFDIAEKRLRLSDPALPDPIQRKILLPFTYRMVELGGSYREFYGIT